METEVEETDSVDLDIEDFPELVAYSHGHLGYSYKENTQLVDYSSDAGRGWLQSL